MSHQTLLTRARDIAPGRQITLKTFLGSSVYILLVLMIVIGILTNPQFRTIDNLLNVLRSVSLIGIAALGMNFVILGGSLVDLSVAATVSVAAVVVLALSSASPLVAIVGALLAGAVIGLLNGALIARFKANPILLTLATTTIVGGALLMATSGRVTYGSGSTLGDLANARIFIIPVPVIALVVLTLICQWVLTSTTWGRRLLAVGGNENAARFAGHSVGRVRLEAFVLSGVFAGITGVFLGSSLGAATPTVGAGYEFDALTAAVVGGSVLTGGRGTAYGVFAGAVLIGVLSNLLILWGAPFAFQQVVKGILLVSVVALGHFLGDDREI